MWTDRRAFFFDLPWLVLLIASLFVFAFLFLVANELVTAQVTSPDGRVDWEAGYLANALVERPVSYNGVELTLGEFLVSVPRSEHGDILGQALVAVQNAGIPDARRISVGVVSADGYVVCPGERWRNDRDCGLSEQVSRVGEYRDYLDRLRSERRETGGVGIVALPSEPEMAVAVVVYR